MFILSSSSFICNWKKDDQNTQKKFFSFAGSSRLASKNKSEMFSCQEEKNAQKIMIHYFLFEMQLNLGSMTKIIRIKLWCSLQHSARSMWFLWTRWENLKVWRGFTQVFPRFSTFSRPGKVVEDLKLDKKIADVQNRSKLSSLIEFKEEVLNILLSIQ